MTKLKNILLILTLTIFIPLKANAILPVGIYYGIRGGLNTTNKDNKINQIKLDTKSGKPFASVNAGIRLLSFRFEAEYAYRYNFTTYENPKSKKINAQNIMGNVYYNFLDLPLLKFFVNGGIGDTKFSGCSGIDNKDNFTWNAGFGVNVSLFNTINLDVGYRYVDMGELKVKNGSDLVKLNQRAQDIYAGLRFGF